MLFANKSIENKGKQMKYFVGGVFYILLIWALLVFEGHIIINIFRLPIEIDSIYKAYGIAASCIVLNIFILFFYFLIRIIGEILTKGHLDLYKKGVTEKI